MLVPATRWTVSSQIEETCTGQVDCIVRTTRSAGQWPILWPVTRTALTAWCAWETTGRYFQRRGLKATSKEEHVCEFPFAHVVGESNNEDGCDFLRRGTTARSHQASRWTALMNRPTLLRCLDGKGLLCLELLLVVVEQTARAEASRGRNARHVGGHAKGKAIFPSPCTWPGPVGQGTKRSLIPSSGKIWIESGIELLHVWMR